MFEDVAMHDELAREVLALCAQDDLIAGLHEERVAYHVARLDASPPGVFSEALSVAASVVSLRSAKDLDGCVVCA
jgi:hypothetical protein